MSLILNIIICVLILGIPVFFIKTIIREIVGHNRRIKRLRKWSTFTSDILKFSNEISDNDVKNEFLKDCIDIVADKELYDTTFDSDKNIKFNDKIDKIEEEMIRKYSNHVPSFKKNLREKNLNKILNQNGKII